MFTEQELELIYLARKDGEISFIERQAYAIDETIALLLDTFDSFETFDSIPANIIEDLT